MGVAFLFQSFVCLVLTLLLLESSATRCPKEITDVNRMCAAALCPKGTFCRVVQSTSSTTCSLQIMCLKCIPRGVDSVCNRNDYYYAVLTTDKNPIGKLTDLKCSMNAEGQQCPVGSTCLPDGTGSGRCCYGKGYPPRGSKGVKNNQTICKDDCGGCASGYECRLMPMPCLVASCPVGPRCVAIERSCPVHPAWVPDYCRTDTRVSTCQSNEDCTGQLCCSDICSIKGCMDGFS